MNLTQRPLSGSLRACLDLRSNAPEVGHGVAELDERRAGRVLARARPVIVGGIELITNGEGTG
eukprot:3690281-Alexandrium_andersonii.AAC.1